VIERNKKEKGKKDDSANVLPKVSAYLGNEPAKLGEKKKEEEGKTNQLLFSVNVCLSLLKKDFY